MNNPTYYQRRGQSNSRYSTATGDGDDFHFCFLVIVLVGISKCLCPPARANSADGVSCLR